MEGLSVDPLEEVEILTDEYAVSHVYGDDLYALAYANGYVQAKNRLFQLDALRHVGYGDSASVLGPGQLKSDVVVAQELYTREELEAQLDRASDRARRALRAFANGVNRGLVEVATSGRIPGEFIGLGHVPEPWSPVDSLAIIAYMTGFFGVDGGEEYSNAQAFATLCDRIGDEEQAYEAYGDLNWLRVPEEHYTTIPRSDLTVDGGEDVPSYEEVPKRQLELARAAGEAKPWGIERDVIKGMGGLASPRAPAQGILAGLKWGSNALAVSGELTDTGRPILMGGPQMGYFKPPAIHEIGLHGDEFDVVGVGVVGTPSVVIGRTPTFAWTVTSGYADMIDTVVVELDPSDRHRFKWDGEWYEMDTEQVTHKTSLLGALADEDADTSVRVVEQEIARLDVDGDRMPVIAWNPDENLAWAQRGVTRGDELAGIFDWAEMGRERDLEGMRERLADFPFAFNFHYADHEQIAFIHTARVPERNPALDHRLPAPSEDHEWRSVTDGTDLGISIENPSRGYLANWNNAPAGGWRAGDYPGRWGTFHRVEVLDRCVRDALGLEDGEDPGEASETIDAGDVRDIVHEASVHDAVAMGTTPLLIEAGEAADDPQLQAMAGELAAWAEADYPWRSADGEHYDDAGHAIWDETRLALQRLVFEPYLGEHTPEVQLDPPKEADIQEWEDPHAGDHGRVIRDTALVRILDGDASFDWLDGQSPTAVAQTALEEAARTLEREFGTDDPQEWNKPIHVTEFMAIGAGEENAMPMLNRGSFNQIVALGPENEPATSAECVLPPSNSGYLPVTKLISTLRGNEPAHLTDQLDRYLESDYKPMPVTREEVEANATQRKTLTMRLDRSVGLGQALRDRVVQASLSVAKRL